MTKSLLFVLLFSCSAAAQIGVVIDFHIKIDVVETRRCTDDAQVVRECVIMYGHFRMKDANTPMHTVRTLLLCESPDQNGSKRMGRKDCMGLKEGDTYAWSFASIDENYPYTLYGDLDVPTYITTERGHALYASKDLDPYRYVSIWH
jgi:hypothetical protein